LIQMGVTPIAAHLFAFYFGLVSAITPPVALAAFAAAGIAGSNPMVTGVHSFRLGIAKYILPFVFVYAPGMVFVGNWHQIVLTIVGSFAGIYALTISTEGWLLVEVKWPVRVFTAFCALLFFLPGLNISISGWAFSLPQWVTQLIAWIILTPAVAWHYIRNREVVQEVAS
jgi:TRAP-type uncharacterized transport system fused permease subunit